MTIGGQVRPRACRMNSVFVPLPEPGAPPRRMNSLGNRRFSRPYSASSSSQTAEKIRAASLISRSGCLAPWAGGGPGSGEGEGEGEEKGAEGLDMGNGVRP